MPRVLLVHTNTSYGETLAQAAADRGWDATLVSRRPVADRLHRTIGAEYDLVQTDELLGNGLLAAGASVLSGVPLVAAVRGWADYTNAHGQYGSLQAASIRARTRAVLGRASEVIFISDAARDRFCEQYPVSEWSVIGRPIDTETYANGTPKVNPETFTLLTVTNLRYREKYEGVRTVLSALEPLFARYPHLRYRVAAGGQYLASLRQFLAEYEYADRVTALGHVESVADELASADGFVYVSFLDAYPTSVLEAQAAGLPVVGGDAVGVPAAVGDAGVLCEPTPTGLRPALDRLVSDEAFRTTLASKSCEKMATYNDSVVDAHVALWERVLGA